MKTPLLLSLSLLLAGSCFSYAAPTPVESLTLEAALEMAERFHPQLAEARALVEAAVGRAQQAGAFPNPEAIVGAQQLPFNGNASSQREYLAGVALPIPLGGRLGKARETGQLDREVRERSLDVTRLHLRKRVHGAFATALYQDRAFLAQRQIAEGAEKAVALSRTRVELGDALPEERALVEMELARARLEFQRNHSLRHQALLALAAAIGDPALKVNSLAGVLEVAFEIPTLESLAANLPSQPELQLVEAGVRASRARMELATAERIPDIKVEALYHRLDATKENAFDIGLSVPLPLFNRNQGRIREASAELRAAEARARTTRNDGSHRLLESYGQLTNALASNRTFQAEILPRAATILKAAEARFAAGDSSLSDVLPVRREWAALQIDYLESLREVMQAWNAVRDLAGAN